MKSCEQLLTMRRYV